MNKRISVNPSEFYSKSAFTLTFTIEILSVDVWHDCNEGWLDLGPCVKAMKIHYQLYPGQNYELDILIWPHVVKIWCGSEYGWVRTWQFLERRWFTFTIRHAFVVRVLELCNCVAVVIPTPGHGVLSANAKSDKCYEVYVPPLSFGEKRYFGTVIDKEETIQVFIHQLILKSLENYIPPSDFDGLFDTPQPVTDVRHQDAVLHFVREVTLNKNIETNESNEMKAHGKEETKGTSKTVEKKKINGGDTKKFEIKIQGQKIISGTGRITMFEKAGEPPTELGDISVFIATSNLPAQDDFPVLFVNIGKLFDIPLKEFKTRMITHMYTKWNYNNQEYNSEPKSLKEMIDFDSHFAIPLQHTASKLTAIFLEIPLEIQIRGIKAKTSNIDRKKLYSREEKNEEALSKLAASKSKTDELDFIIAITKIDAKDISKGSNIYINGEYSLYPPNHIMEKINRQTLCTNDINAIKNSIQPNFVIQPYIVLQAHMTIEVSFGLVGCKLQRLSNSYSRLYSIIKISECATILVHRITLINDEISEHGKRDDLLTGFAVDMGEAMLLYVEGPKDGHILRVWEFTEEFYPNIKPVFSSSYRYPSRIYTELLVGHVPFIILKMYVPLSVLLACLGVYVRPTMPVLARSAVLKLGRLVASGLPEAPPRSDMPTTEEIGSFRLELCTPLHPAPLARDTTYATAAPNIQ